ncbi:hypothetical protein DDF65_23645 [Caulobacter radicis]|uniref:Uncharacterized protein n=2 Tax=Caulobacter radicis TaxID=2172650 RepID=A0A2T9IXD8_9CAUL|nr:hypothetical protein DDF65_23645 [Caulobacter radicis]
MMTLAAAQGAAGISVEQVAEALIIREAAAKIRATTIAMRQADADHDADDLLVSVAHLAGADTTAELKQMAEHLEKSLSGRTAVGDRPRREILIALDLCVYLRLLEKIRRIADLIGSKKGWSRMTADGLSQSAASVRQALEVSVPLARSRLDLLEARLASIETGLRSAKGTKAAPAPKKPLIGNVADA